MTVVFIHAHCVACNAGWTTLHVITMIRIHAVSKRMIVHVHVHVHVHACVHTCTVELHGNVCVLEPSSDGN